MGRLLQEDERNIEEALEPIAEEPNNEANNPDDIVEAGSNQGELYKDDSEKTDDENPDQQETEVEEGENRRGEKSKKTPELAGDLISHQFIFGVIFSRCRDCSATVRAKALQTLADVTASDNQAIEGVIKTMFEEGPQDDNPNSNRKKT